MEEEGGRGGGFKRATEDGKGISRVGPARACIGSFLFLPKKMPGYCKISPAIPSLYLW